MGGKANLFEKVTGLFGINKLVNGSPAPAPAAPFVPATGEKTVIMSDPNQTTRKTTISEQQRRRAQAATLTADTLTDDTSLGG